MRTPGTLLRLATAIVALVAGGMTSGATVAEAAEAKATNCFSDRANNNRVWQSRRTDGGGHVNWNERGDQLWVYDRKGGGQTVAWFWYCYDQKWRLREYTVNGTDQTIDFDFKETRRVRIIACRYVSPGRGDDCGSAEYGNA